jgi:hypothetical protein
MWCRHKYGKREEDGYQYCINCGKARKLSCVHKWKREDIIPISFAGSTTGYLRIYECEFCGELKREKVTA